ncbi:MAG: long-chain-fatty-acid--CoA ligase [Nocardioides sp.]
MLNLSFFLEESARKYPDRDAVVLGATRLTYAQVDGAANQVANLLVSRGIGPGDKVALSCLNLPYFPIVYYGILKAGGIVVPLNVLLKGREVAYHLADSEAAYYLAFEGTEALPMGTESYAGYQQALAAGAPCRGFLLITADPAAASPIDGVETFGQALAGMAPEFRSVETNADDGAVILYTSGTTGQAKGALLSHSNLVMNAIATNDMFGARRGRETHLITLPLFHTFGATVQMNGGFACAATLVLLPRFDADQAVALMQSERITIFAGVPTMWWGLLQALGAGVDVAAIASTLRVAMSGGSSLALEIIREVKERLGVQILEGYGLSETSPVATFTDAAFEPRPGSIGRPIWGIECKLIDDEWNPVESTAGSDNLGEIAIRGHNIMLGYYNRPEATAEVMRDGWFRTGDLARRDDDGFYYIVDRAKDMIIRGGFNVYPREVEEVLMTHEAVSLAAVVGVPDEQYGEEVKAFVIRKPESSVTADELVAWSKDQMASFKYPRSVEFRDAFPMTASGKILKRELG